MSKTGLGRLGRLSSGERLLIERLRKNETQTEAAIRRGTTYFIYGQWERDADRDDIPKGPNFERLTVSERCILHRRRQGWTQGHLAERLLLSRWYVILMEQGKKNPEPLRLYLNA